MAVAAPARVKYTAADVEQLGTEEKAFRDGADYSHPVVDDDDFAKAARIADTPELRAFVVDRALAMGKLGAVPDDWSELAEYEGRRDYSDADRQDAAKKGEALSDGSYPIKSEQDLKNAIQAVGRAKDRGRAIAHIKKRAKAMGLTSLLPDSWGGGGESKSLPEGMGADARGDDMSLEQRKRKAEAMRGAREERHYPARDLEVRERADGGINLTGYASVTGTPYPMAWYEESLAPGAFKRTLKDDPDVVLLLNHEGLPLARTKAGTLALEEDKRGLHIDADLDPREEDTHKLVRKLARGDLDGQMSFAFQATDEEWNEEHTERTIRSVSLHRGDVSIVTHGANPATTAAISRETLIDTLRAGASAALEYRAGKAISAGNEAKIQQALSEASSIDKSADAIQSNLAEVLGVANPDTDDEDEPREQPMISFTAGSASEALSAPPPDEVARARRELEILNWGRADGR